MGLEYLGTAIKYPLELTSGGRPALVSGKESVNQAIANALGEQLGTKFFLPEYGSRLKSLIFEQNDTVLFDLISLLTYEVISKWETRVQFIKVDCERTADYVACTISYRILASNEIDSFVYPFYTTIKY